MSEDPTDLSDLEAAITAVYRGPHEQFIARRDALAKQLRAAKRRDDADRVKALRKSSRAAWALNQAVFEASAPVEQLAEAIRTAQSAHATAAGARAAQDNVKARVRAAAEAGVLAASRGGHPIESSALVAALRAVIGDSEAFASFRAGRLVDVPEGGGLDLLATMSFGGAPAPAKAEPATKGGAREGAAAAPAHEDDQVSARAQTEEATAAVAMARERAKSAERAVLDALASVEAAEEQLQRAQGLVEARRNELERARQDASAASLALDEADKILAR